MCPSPCFSLPMLPPTLSYVLNRKHQASRDKDHSTHQGGARPCARLRALHMALCPGPAPPPPAPELAQWCL